MPGSALNSKKCTGEGVVPRDPPGVCEKGLMPSAREIGVDSIGGVRDTGKLNRGLRQSPAVSGLPLDPAPKRFDDGVPAALPNKVGLGGLLGDEGRRLGVEESHP
mmetsp:Transcript_110926/g.318682  ORF Transcript_110926/g.318682 Transcript_110926/m.318682 type:complete len:105 (-) Transcript_110926:1115-1429(-)